ncbi:hypothetical protein [Planomonospora sp. ID82291]|nr:hypothetical protein [Planomonospora sp. ID82291]
MARQYGMSGYGRMILSGGRGGRERAGAVPPREGGGTAAVR